MKKLIEKLKKAKDQSAFLDAEIAVALGAEAERQKRGWRMRHAPWLPYSGAHWHCLPDYTDKIDHALTLIPEGMFWVAGYGKTREREPLGGASVMKPDDLDNHIGQGEAATVALAICIAALEARLSLQSST